MCIRDRDNSNIPKVNEDASGITAGINNAVSNKFKINGITIAHPALNHVAIILATK